MCDAIVSGTITANRTAKADKKKHIQEFYRTRESIDLTASWAETETSSSWEGWLMRKRSENHGANEECECVERSHSRGGKRGAVAGAPMSQLLSRGTRRPKPPFLSSRPDSTILRITAECAISLANCPDWKFWAAHSLTDAFS